MAFLPRKEKPAQNKTFRQLSTWPPMLYSQKLKWLAEEDIFKRIQSVNF